MSFCDCVYGFDYFGVAVTHAVDCDTCDKIEILVAIAVPDLHPFATDQHDRVPAIVAGKVLVAQLDDFLVFGLSSLGHGVRGKIGLRCIAF